MTETVQPAAWQAPLLDLLSMLARRKVLIAAIVMAGVSAGVLKYMRTPPFYRASSVAVLMPREKPTVDITVLSGTVEMKEDAAKRADSGSLMLPPDTDLYIALLGSRPVLESLAATFEQRLTTLDQVKPNDRSDEIVVRLRDMLKVQGTDEGLLTVTVTADDPQLAADLANELVAEGQRASKAIERQLLVQQAGHLEDAVAHAQGKLYLAESWLKTYCERHRLIDPPLQASDRLRQVREIEAIRDRRVVELAQRRMQYTDADPRVRQLDEEIRLSNERVHQLRSEITGGVGERDYGRLLVEYEGLRQQVRFRRDLLATLSTQTEVFRIRAEQPAGSMAVVRPAVAVAKPAGPSKKSTLLVSVGGAIFAAVCVALLLEQVRLARNDPSLQNHVATLRESLIGSSRRRNLGRS
jgi:uncharacterized protein involved in exopolysaccharide biosynthesis